ncbi:Protein of unknown function [Pyronema omphalodes CBS 100304]|uniref:Uncharacterized protein n=1 Tax=Pyronema omphalodes (strain CBS 100304) TaxID=1076935 RepID=U4L6N7_PYROM|nr:Protein of unknown function [Pyronema omphalodes CBS 100304]
MKGATFSRKYMMNYSKCSAAKLNGFSNDHDIVYGLR